MSASENPSAPQTEQSVSGAVPVSEKQFHGRPCKTCGGTLRRNCDSKCVVCRRRHQREYQRRKYQRDSEWAERSRRRHREFMRHKYANDPEWRSRVLAQNRQRHQERTANDPEWVERLRERQRRLRQEQASNPEWVERERERQREWRANLGHIRHYERQLKTRRYQALKRKEARHNGSLSDEG